jgi:transcriptional regulator with XRE-family HTH domain
MDMSERIKICLKQKKMTLKDLSGKADIPLSTLSDLMNNKTKKLDVQKAKDISIALGCTLDYLIDADLLHEEIGKELKDERARQGYSVDDLSEATCIPSNVLQGFEESEERINFFLLKKICEVYGITISDFYVNTELYDLYIPEEFNGDVNSLEAFQKAVEEDALKDTFSKNEVKPLPPLTQKEERDIAHDLEKMLSDLESDEDIAFQGEPMDDDDRETLRIFIENSLRLAKQMAKKKFNSTKK